MDKNIISVGAYRVQRMGSMFTNYIRMYINGETQTRWANVLTIFPCTFTYIHTYLTLIVY